jgi:hypothetical protein
MLSFLVVGLVIMSIYKALKYKFYGSVIVLSISLVVVGLIFALVLAFPPHDDTEMPADVAPESGGTNSTTTSTENAQAIEMPDTTQNPIGVFSTNSDGHTWHVATESAKRELCHRLAAASAHETTPSFFYDLIEETYNTTDESVLKQQIDLVVRLGDSNSSQ